MTVHSEWRRNKMAGMWLGWQASGSIRLHDCCKSRSGAECIWFEWQGWRASASKKGWRQEVGGNYSPQCWRRMSWTGHLSHPKGHQCPTTDRHTQDRTGRKHHSTQTGVWKGQGADAKEVKSQTKQGKSNVRSVHQSTRTKCRHTQVKRASKQRRKQESKDRKH